MKFLDSKILEQSYVFHKLQLQESAKMLKKMLRACKSAKTKKKIGDSGPLPTTADLEENHDFLYGYKKNYLFLCWPQKKYFFTGLAKNPEFHEIWNFWVSSKKIFFF